jgi:hypothetical protein
MCKDPLQFLKHISDECTYLVSVTNHQLSKEAFLDD